MLAVAARNVLDADRGVVHGGEAHAVHRADVHVLGTQEDVAVGLVAAHAVVDAPAAVLEEAIPDVDVQRVPVDRGDAFVAAEELATEDGVFRRAVGLGVAEVQGDAVDVLEDQVTQFAIGGEPAGPDQPSVGLLSPVEPQPADLAVPGVVTQDRFVGRAIPEQDGGGRVRADQVRAR